MHAHQLSCNQVQCSVIVSRSKVIYLLWVFYFFEEYIWPKVCFGGLFLLKTAKIHLRTSITLQKQQETAQAITLMMPALNITIGYVRPTKIFHNITVSLCFKSVTSPVTSKISRKYTEYQKGRPSRRNFSMNFYIWHERVCI